MKPLPPGPLLDLEISRARGYTIKDGRYLNPDTGRWQHPLPYSTDEATALSLFQDAPFYTLARRTPPGALPARYYAHAEWTPVRTASAEAETLALAICEVVLKVSKITP